MTDPHTTSVDSACNAPVIGKPHGYTTAYDPQNGPAERWTLLQCPEGHTMFVL